MCWIAEALDVDVWVLLRFVLYQKRKATKSLLKRMNKDIYGEIPQRVKATPIKLECVQGSVLMQYGNASLVLRANELLHQYICIRNPEEAFFKQKA